MSLPKPLDDDGILDLLSNPLTAERGFRMLVEKYQQSLYHHIRSMVGGHDDAHDVLQNCLMKAYKGLGSFEGRSKLFTWLYRIATNEALTHNARAKRSRSIMGGNMEQEQVQAKQADESPEGDMIQRKLQLAIEQLPEKQRAVFMLRYYQEMPYEEMSAALGTTVGALKASYHHAIKKIESFVLDHTE